MNSCCPSSKPRFDFILWGSLSAIVMSVVLSALSPTLGINNSYLDVFSHAVIEFLSTMWWGITLGIVAVGLMSKIPKDYFTALLGRGDSFGGLIRATIAGLFLDLCSHGILLIGAKLYERGASLAQVMTFLIASPWNSFSLTLILFALIGWKWTLTFIASSVVVAILTGLLYQILTRRGILPDNPNTAPPDDSFSLREDFKSRIKAFRPTRQFFLDITLASLKDSRMLLRWLLLGIVIASCIQTFIPHDIFTTWFGPTLAGLGLTLIATTIIEVCSEGSAPIASDLFNRASAPGNAFVFLMAGVSTDYTEIMIIRETTKSWLVALSLPLMTVPQILLLGYIMNLAAGG